MKKETICTKCKSETTIKRVKANIMIDKETNYTMPVSARLQICSSCGNKEYNEKELARLRELTTFYQKEFNIKKEEAIEEENEIAESL
ncbi:hypothetical protein CVD28_00095 [Bacillus sp. M6-12]|uniref:hypothetical protein n=1 Tax=Bacillus sp. M6-12 TaxID=2054166 RepID=UPI000C77F7E6|nr:hypothetical protein [Bacillus sp. M6-12]PLS18837.1 hypothetical protein CVD28_00095 [Bacillus sp. M6-12]